MLLVLLIYISLLEQVPLVIVLKAFLFQNDFNDPSKGGLGGYALILLIVYYLQQRANQDRDLGKLLIDFFQFYGSIFDMNSVISVRGNGCLLDKKSKGWTDKKKDIFLCIEDPLDIDNNVAKSCFKFREISNLFYQSYIRLKTPYLSQIIDFNDSKIAEARNVQEFVDKEKLYFQLQRQQLILQQQLIQQQLIQKQLIQKQENFTKRLRKNEPKNKNEVRS